MSSILEQAWMQGTALGLLVVLLIMALVYMRKDIKEERAQARKERDACRQEAFGREKLMAEVIEKSAHSQMEAALINQKSGAEVVGIIRELKILIKSSKTVC